jgi:hypothetical protein
MEPTLQTLLQTLHNLLPRNRLLQKSQLRQISQRHQLNQHSRQILIYRQYLREERHREAYLSRE